MCNAARFNIKFNLISLNRSLRRLGFLHLSTIFEVFIQLIMGSSLFKQIILNSNTINQSLNLRYKLDLFMNEKTSCGFLIKRIITLYRLNKLVNWNLL